MRSPDEGVDKLSRFRIRRCLHQAREVGAVHRVSEKVILEGHPRIRNGRCFHQAHQKTPSMRSLETRLNRHPESGIVDEPINPEREMPSKGPEYVEYLTAIPASRTGDEQIKPEKKMACILPCCWSRPSCWSRGSTARMSGNPLFPVGGRLYLHGVYEVHIVLDIPDLGNLAMC